MKVLLVHPTCERWVETPTEAEPGYAPSIGVNSLATVLEDEKHEVFVLDELAKWFLDKHFGYMDWTSRTLHLLQERQIELLGITVLTHFRALALGIAQAAKAQAPGLRIVLGGPHATFAHRQILERFPEVVDAVVVGEGETPLLTLARRMEDKESLEGPRMAGVATPSYPTADLFCEARIPVVSYTRYMELSQDKGFSRGFAMARRGCPHHACIFCTTQAMRRSALERDPDELADEIAGLARCGVRSLAFQDDVFAHDRLGIGALFTRLDKREVEFDEHYAHCRSGDLNEEFAETLAITHRKWKVFIGLESGSPTIRRTLHKFDVPVTNDEILAGVRGMQTRGIPVGVFVMFGTPGERQGDVEQTYHLLRDIRPTDAFCSVLRLYPGTDICRRAIGEGRFTDSDWLDKLDQPCFFYPQGDDWFRAMAACELFSEWFCTEQIRRHAEQSVDAKLMSQTQGERRRINEWKRTWTRMLNPQSS
jgi:radical SAM superfamily enzyme YgiQ (UPF0313 family)